MTDNGIRISLSLSRSPLAPGAHVRALHRQAAAAVLDGERVRQQEQEVSEVWAGDLPAEAHKLLAAHASELVRK